MKVLKKCVQIKKLKRNEQIACTKSNYSTHKLEMNHECKIIFVRRIMCYNIYKGDQICKDEMLVNHVTKFDNLGRIDWEVQNRMSEIWIASYLIFFLTKCPALKQPLLLTIIDC